MASSTILSGLSIMALLSFPDIAPKAEKSNFIIGPWTGHAETTSGVVTNCVAEATVAGGKSAPVLSMFDDGSTYLTIGDERWPVQIGNHAVVNVRVDQLDLGGLNGVVAVEHAVTIPLSGGRLEAVFGNAAVFTAGQGGRSFSLPLGGSGIQILARLSRCIAESPPAPAVPSEVTSSSTSGVTTLACTFRNHLRDRDSVSCMTDGVAVQCANSSPSDGAFSFDLSFDESKQQILNRSVSGGPRFSDSNISWEEKRADKHTVVSYVLERHSGAARIFVSSDRNKNMSLTQDGTCTLAPHRQF